MSGAEFWTGFFLGVTVTLLFVMAMNEIAAARRKRLWDEHEEWQRQERAKLREQLRGKP